MFSNVAKAVVLPTCLQNTEKAMRLLVSITQTKNLTLGALVSDLKASKSFIPGHGLVQDKVALDVSGGNDTLCISIRNTQTQAYVCERKIPLSLLSTGIPWSSWVELLPPGDACATLDQVQPSPDQPQIFVTLEYGSSADIGKNGFEDLEALQHAFSKLERELELNKQQARERTSALAARPSLLDQEAAEIQAKEREMAAIRAKISAMSDAKRQASSAEEQLKEVMQEVAKMRDRWTQIETEVKDVNDRKLITETEISRLQRSMSEAKETLRLRTLSVAELRSNHDETERQLSQTLREREQWRESASKAQNDFDSEVKSASVELDHWRSEAQELATSIEELDEQKQALAQKASQEQGVQNDFMDALQKELEEAMSSFTSIEAQRSADGQHLAAAEERQRDAQERLQQAEQQAFELRSELREEGARAKSATEAVKKDLADKVSRVAQLEGSLSENRNQLKTIQQHVDGLMQDLMERTIKSSDDEAMLGTLARQLQQEQQDLEQIELEKEKLEKAVSQVLKHSEESRYQKQSLQDGYREEQGQLAQRSDMLSNTQTMAFTELERTSAQIAQLKEAKLQLDSELAQVDAAAGDVEGCRQEARQRIEEMQKALEAVNAKKLVQAEVVTSRLHRVTAMEQELITAKQELQSAMAAASQLRISAARNTAENATKEEALLQRFVQLKSELEEHQELSKQQEDKQKVLLDKLNETHQQRPKTRVQAEHAKAKRSELQKIAASLKASLDAAKEAAAAEAMKANQMEQDLEMQRKELEHLAEEAARQEAVSAAMKTALSEQRAMHQSCVEARRGQSATAKDQELKVEEQVSELRVHRAEMAIKQEAVAAACMVEKVQAATVKKIDDATKDLAVQECATSLEARLSQIDKELSHKKERFSADLKVLESHRAEAGRLRQRLEDHAQAQLARADNGPAVMEDGKDSEKKTKLLKELLTHRAASLQEATEESNEAEKNVQALEQQQRSLQEEYRIAMQDMKSQVSKGNEHYSKLQELEEDIRTFDDESELLTLGLHEAENRKEYLLKEYGLLQQASSNFDRHLLQQWAKEVLRLRVAAQVQSYKDELEHWKQAASEAQPDHAAVTNASSHQQAAEELLRQKANALEEQLAAKERKLKEFEQQLQPEEIPGNIRSVPPALHGSLFLGPTLSGMDIAQRRALVIGCNYCNSFAALKGCANDAWNMNCLLRQSLQYPESQVRSLIDFSGSTASPPKRLPTRENIIAELQWLTGNAKPGDNILLYFSRYGAQQPVSEIDGLYEGHLVPMDFAEDLPEDVLHELQDAVSLDSPGLSSESLRRAVHSGGYRLVPMSLITSALHSLPPKCKVTLLLDCCQSSVVPLLRPSEARASGGPGPPLFKRLAPRIQAMPKNHSASMRLLNLPPLPGGQSLRPSTSPTSSPSKSSTHVASPQSMKSPTYQEAPALPQPSALDATQHHGSVSRGGPSCKCYSFAMCQNDQVCYELPIEGSVQGAGTWAFVKAVAACHFSVSLAQHSKAMDSILQNLRRKYRWIQQTPVIQLSASANVEDTLILP